MLPFGMIGVTVLTVVMPRLSRNAAADDIPGYWPTCRWPPG